MASERDGGTAVAESVSSDAAAPGGPSAEPGVEPSAEAGNFDEPVSRWTVLAVVVAALAIVVGSVVLARLVGAPEGVVREVTIPFGTAERVRNGEPVDVIPADLAFQLRDRLVIRNDDEVVHNVGPLQIAPGQTLDTRFSEVVSLDGFCSLHPSGSVTIDVRPRS